MPAVIHRVVRRTVPASRKLGMLMRIADDFPSKIEIRPAINAVRI
jgi:hypothetical protein